jgi:tRNA nucleotidyltransferase (CCA-adding enzyme)
VLELRAKADELMLRENAPRPILQGRNLIERGLKPGKHFSAILDAAFEAQMEGQFGDLPQALAWLDRRGGAGGSDSAA